MEISGFNMRFKEFLLEKKQTTEEISDFDTVIKKIRAHCGRFLTASNFQPLYRGMKVSPKTFHFFERPDNRAPKDSSPEFNLFFNTGIELAFGEKDIRKKTLFATGSADSAAQYGELGFTFPSGNIKYMYSLDLEDSHAVDVKIFKKLYLELFGERIGMVEGYLLRQQFFKIADYQNDEKIQKILKKSGSEVRAAMKTVFKKEYQTKNLEKGIRSNNEILFFKSSGFYFLPLEAVRNQMVMDGIDMTFHKMTNTHDEKIYRYLSNALQGMDWVDTP